MLLAGVLSMLRVVKRPVAKSICLFGLFALTVPALEAADEEEGHPFKHITERNVFALKPPPPPPDPSDIPPPPPPLLAKVTLTGILNVLGPPRALLEVTENEPGKPAGQSKKPILREGEREGSIEVLSIDVNKNLVKIKNGSFETNLTFEVQKQTTAGAVAIAPPPMLQPPPGMTPGTPEGETPGRRGVVVAGGTPLANNPQGNATMPNPTMQMPTRQIRSSQVQQPATDPVAQWVQLKAQEERARQQANSVYPPVPTPPGLEPDGAAPVAPPNNQRRLPFPPPPVPQ
jgi:hypothetical protein